MPQDVSSEFLDGAQLEPVTENLWLLSKPSDRPNEWLYRALVTREIIETIGADFGVRSAALDTRYG